MVTLTTATTIKTPATTATTSVPYAGLGELALTIRFNYSDQLGFCEVDIEAQQDSSAAQIAHNEALYAAICELAGQHLGVYVAGYREAMRDE